MRPLELVVSIVNILALCCLAIPRLRSIQWAGFVAPVAVLIVGIQVLAEGARWQMVPAYGLSIVLLLVWLVRVLGPGRVHVGQPAAGGVIAIGALVLAASIALPVVLPVFRFPAPTGPYGIGTATYHWVDASRPELFTADPNDHRELMAQVWYPARQAPPGPRAPYIEDADAVTRGLSRLVHLPSFFFAHFKYVTTNAVPAASVADDGAAYPVLIFLSGLGGFRASNTYQVEELVSRGHVVVGLDQPGGSAAVRFPDGREVAMLPREEMQSLIQQSTSPVHDAPVLNGQALPDGIIPYFAQDAVFAIDRLTELNENDPIGRLTGRLDLQRVGVLGISLGAIAAGEASLMDARIKASLMMDAAMPADVVRAGLQQPCLWITRPASDMRLERSRSGGWPEAAIAETLTTMRAAFDAHAPGSAYYLDAPGMFHVNFTDAPFWSPITPQLGQTGPVDGRHMFDIVSAYALAFFDTYLKGRRETLLDDPDRHYPEVILQRR